MGSLLVLALLQLDLAGGGAMMPAERGGLRIEAVVEGRRVAARLVNAGKGPIEVLVGFTCGGPEPFSAVIDGEVKNFQTGMIVCSGNAMVMEKLAPGERKLVRSEALVLDGKAHRVAVKYRNDAAAYAPKVWSGEIASAAVGVPAATLAVELSAKVEERGAIEIQIVHRWNGTTRMRFMTGWAGVCAGPQDSLLLDGRVRGFIEETCDGPGMPLSQEVEPGGMFVTRGTIHPGAGYHRVRARYRVTPEDLKPLGIKGNIGDWTGDVETPEVNVLVR